MSLLKRLALTARKLEANQANAHLSRGPATAAGIERIREAHLLHGFYSKGVGEAIRTLGEKPDDFERLVESLTETWQPESGYEQALVRRLARALWRVERADRIQEAMTVNQVERVALNIEEDTERASNLHKQKLAALERLLEQAQHGGFHSTMADLQGLEALTGKRPKGRQAEIAYLMCRLLQPSDPASQAVADQVIALENDCGEIEAGAGGGADPALDPTANLRAQLAPATAAQRDRLRSQLRSLVRQEIEAEQAAYRQERDRSAREITPAALDAAMAPTSSRAEFMLRSETAVFRQVKELTELLMRLRRFRQSQNHEPATPPPLENEGKSHDVVDNKGSSPEADG
jgi:hypothetical protein